MIHPTAIIDPSAQLAENVSVGPWTYIGPDVEIGEGTCIHSHVVIKGPTRIGCDNEIFQFASIGEVTQDKKYEGEITRLEIGDRNIFRESVTIHRGTAGGGYVTRIGDDNLLMAYVHIAHDCQVGSHSVFSNNASLAGHVIVDDFVVLGGFSGVHQFCRVGAHSFLAMSAMVNKDVPPFVKVSGYYAEPFGLNAVGLQRRGYSNETIAHLKRAYKILYRQGLGLQEALAELEKMTAECEEVNILIQFLQQSERGIAR
ncbi:MAG: acyl-ACP--UDP-N-acetylglucosamine O-acyltransferase [Legionellales bacterium]|nr:acyl-ACP--UDP-N-acetylglucosamine O-acyltransferase [Legionellales bacterium]